MHLAQELKKIKRRMNSHDLAINPSLLIAIALDQKLINSTQQKISDFFPAYLPFKNDSKWKRSITIQHLLDMQSGFDCEEFNDTKDCETAMSANSNWVKVRV